MEKGLRWEFCLNQQFCTWTLLGEGVVDACDIKMPRRRGGIKLRLSFPASRGDALRASEEGRVPARSA
jgi:hypothetical protein